MIASVWSRRELLAGGAFLALTPQFTIQPAVGLDQRLRSYSLKEVFSETFEEPLSFWQPRTRKGRWKTNYFYGDPFGPSGRIINDEIVVDQDYCGIDPFVAGDGQIKLRLARTNSLDPRLGGKKLTAGLLTTERSFTQTYGYFECRFASPGTPGCWPAFWLYSAPVPDLTGTQWDNGLGYSREWTGGLNDEIDVIEILTNNTKQTNHTACARHAWKDDVPGAGFELGFKPEIVGTHVAPCEGTTSPRTYGLLWTAEQLVWYVDDAEVFRGPNPGIHDPMYLIVSMGAGGWNGNALPSHFTNAEMVVDYVRVYTLA